MSKKKNTLKDLDEFLKQQAASLVSPSRLNEKSEASESKANETVGIKNDDSTKSVSKISILNDLNQLAQLKGDAFKTDFHDIILKVLETQNEFTAEDKMLVNTILYIKHGSDWKEAIRKFWEGRNG
jgi:hypothetical protein